MEKLTGYDVAQICLNGHIITTTVKLNPEKLQNFCEKCGAKTITECPHCVAPIRGYYHMPATFGGKYHLPLFCHNCGEPYPWTQSKLETIEKLIDKIGLTREEKRLLKQNIWDLVKETPRAEVAALEVKDLKKKTEKRDRKIWEVLEKILIELLSETAVKLYFAYILD